ncbi:hypothetical protein NQ314_019450 [Rhamnusium bicolor]|uniref:Prolyl 3,4-dihydroxylase TPA1/OFD1 N-terminal domain-containing protein n=1 Tax=Rhamnusium bicolor TaxID=1586634 RepID=A0AAV8WNW4_9CUCU|nr:hypothetical protein NQ314_019450 [Rhamnusium bicolor]
MNSKGKKNNHYQIANKKDTKCFDGSEDSDDESELSDERVTYYEESSESEPDIDCSIWDCDCKILPTVISAPITGYHLMPTCSRNPDLQPKKKQKIVPEINPHLLDKSLIDDFKENWYKNTSLLNDKLELIIDPFKVANLTDLDLTDISATCSLYSNTDYLLVHDDQREDRLVAFVLYLTDNWNESKGGALQLLNKDDKGQPLAVVAEVTSMNDCRLSINGWFHTKIPPTFEMPLYTPLENGLYSKNIIKVKEVDIDLESWINEDYLEVKAIKVIQEYIEVNSEISLRGFFKKESFNEILQTLKSEGNELYCI